MQDSIFIAEESSHYLGFKKILRKQDGFFLLVVYYHKWEFGKPLCQANVNQVGTLTAPIYLSIWSLWSYERLYLGITISGNLDQP